MNEINKKYRQNNKQKIAEINKKWVESHRETVNLSAKKWYDSNKDKKHEYYLKKKAERLLILEKEDSLETSIPESPTPDLDKINS
jgi:hypothetical protein